MYGRVTRYFKDRGFGFISGEDGNSYFVHCSKLQGEYIESGYYVSFKPFSNEKSEYNARDVIVIEAPERKRLKSNKRKEIKTQ